MIKLATAKILPIALALTIAACATGRDPAPATPARPVPAPSAAVSSALSASAGGLPVADCVDVQWLASLATNAKVADARDENERVRLLNSVAQGWIPGGGEAAVATHQLADAARVGDDAALKRAVAHADEIVFRSACGAAVGRPEINGRVPPVVIQRIVRREFGKFKLCYENGLKKAPTIAGRVATKFVIDRTGHVATADDAGSDPTLPEDVRACVVDSFKKLEFPIPEGGIVTVVYPLIFSPGD